MSALQSLVPHGVLRLRDDTYTNSVLAVMTEAVYALDDPELAAQLRAQMAPLAGRLVTMRYIAVIGAADRYLAMHDALLGKFDLAFDAFARALDLELHFGSLTLASQTRAWPTPKPWSERARARRRPAKPSPPAVQPWKPGWTS